MLFRTSLFRIRLFRIRPFRIRRHDNLVLGTVLRAMRAAILAHRPAVLHTLLAAHGERTFVRALNALSGRARDDALSMLCREDRARLGVAMTTPVVKRFPRSGCGKSAASPQITQENRHV